MTWFRVDDKMGSHPKVLSIPRSQRLAVMGLWLAGGTWCAGQLTDGLLPAYMLAELGGSKRQAQALVDAGLWEDLGTAGWEFHGWSEYQPTREHVENERSKARERMTKLRSGSPDVRANKGRSSEPVRDPRPDPSLPDLEEPPLATLGPPHGEAPAAAETSKRGHRLPDGWEPPLEAVAAMREEFPDLDLRASHARFTDHWTAAAGRTATKRDWLAAWRNWVREDARRYRVPQQRRIPETDLDLDAARARALAREAASA